MLTKIDQISYFNIIFSRLDCCANPNYNSISSPLSKSLPTAPSSSSKSTSIVFCIHGNKFGVARCCDELSENRLNGIETVATEQIVDDSTQENEGSTVSSGGQSIRVLDIRIAILSSSHWKMSQLKSFIYKFLEVLNLRLKMQRSWTWLYHANLEHLIIQFSTVFIGK